MPLILPRRALLATASLAALALAGCASDASQPARTTDGPTMDPATTAFLTEHGLPTTGARAVIDTLEALPLEEKPADLLASVGTDVLTLADATGSEVTLPLPAEQVYLAVAPFVDATHECFLHSLTTCTGELAGQEVQVRVSDGGARPLIDETRTPAANGFLGLWLPRDRTLTLTIGSEAGEVSATHRTLASAATCLTTMRLPG